MPIGISFMPSAQGVASSPSAPQAGANTDLAQAFKILSLRLPQILGTGAITPLAGTAGGTNTDALKSVNPYAAVFQAMLRSITGGISGDQSINTTGLGDTYPGASSTPIDTTPSIIFKQPQPSTPTTPGPGPTIPSGGGLAGGGNGGAQY